MSRLTHARMIVGEAGINNPVIQMVITPHEDDVFKQVGLVDVHMSSNEARELGYNLLGLSSEADAQSGYITALRALKETEEEIMDVVGEASLLIAAKRGAGT